MKQAVDKSFQAHPLSAKCGCLGCRTAIADGYKPVDYPYDDSVPMDDRPFAAVGLRSYRCKGRYGWIMIGATDHDGAMGAALRSSDAAQRETLEIWNGQRYVAVPV